MATIINGVGRVGIRVTPQSGGPTPPSYLLDTYGGASVAYSLRKLSSTYSGSSIRVRRSSDNTEQNIGFDISGNLDTTALTTFVGDGNGFVTTWYDQSGNGKTMGQITASAQPLIVSLGNMISRNGKPTIKFSASNTFNPKYLSMTNGPVDYSSTNHSFFMTYEKDSMDNRAVLINNNTSYLFLDYNNIIYNGNNEFRTSIPSNSFKLISLTHTLNTSIKLYMNNSVLSTLTSTTDLPSLKFSYINYYGYSYGVFYTNEIITYPNNQISNISDINSNINTYYSIY